VYIRIGPVNSLLVFIDCCLTSTEQYYHGNSISVILITRTRLTNKLCR